MLTTSNKTARHFFVLLLSAIALTSFSLISVQAGQARSEERPREFKADKISPHLKGHTYSADKKVTVIVTLNGPKSAQLNAFMRRAGVRQRLELKQLGTFSLSLPFGMVSELSSFSEVSFVSSNETVRSFG